MPSRTSSLASARHTRYPSYAHQHGQVVQSQYTGGLGRDAYGNVKMPTSSFPPVSTPTKAKNWALRRVQDKVLAGIRECYPTVHYFPKEKRYIQGSGFYSLISAMYLQMMWLLTASEEDIRRCRLPRCNKIISYEQPKQVVDPGLKKNDRSKGYRTRSDKEFCNDICRGKFHYHYVKKGKRPSEAS